MTTAQAEPTAERFTYSRPEDLPHGCKLRQQWEDHLEWLDKAQ